MMAAFAFSAPVIRVRDATTSVEDVKLSYRCAQSRRILPTAKRSSGKARERRRGDGRRPSRISELIFREITSIVEDGFARAFDGESDDVPVVVSVVGVTCSQDLRAARVRLSIMGNEEQKKIVFKWLKDARKSLRYELAQCIRLKYVPELQFGEGEEPSAERTIRIIERLAEERKLKEIAAPEPSDEIHPFDEDGAILEDGDDSIGPSYMNEGEPEIIDIGDDDEETGKLTRLATSRVNGDL